MLNIMYVHRGIWLYLKSKFMEAQAKLGAYSGPSRDLSALSELNLTYFRISALNIRNL
jgi:hypothetical protein